MSQKTSNFPRRAASIKVTQSIGNFCESTILVTPNLRLKSTFV